MSRPQRLPLSWLPLAVSSWLCLGMSAGSLCARHGPRTNVNGVPNMVGNGPLNLAHLRGAQNGVLARLSSKIGSISEENKSTMGPNLGGKKIAMGPNLGGNKIAKRPPNTDKTYEVRAGLLAIE